MKFGKMPAKVKWLIWLNILLPVTIKVFIPDFRYGVIPEIASELTTVPLGLIILNAWLYHKQIEKSLFKCFVFMLIGLTSGELTGYLRWGFDSGKLLKPDNMTIFFASSILAYLVGITVIAFLILGVGFKYARIRSAKRGQNESI